MEDALTVSPQVAQAAASTRSEAEVRALKGVRDELDEEILPDDYPIYGNYLYVADGKPVVSDWHGITARQFKAYIKATELRRCDISGRQRRANAAQQVAAEAVRHD